MVIQHPTRDMSFIIPQETPEVGFTQDSYTKRLATAKKWAGVGVKDEVSIENTPLSGFAIETLNGRYRTEVEYICIRHPEGYVFEVPFQNLLDIIKEVGCGVGGVIQKECYLAAVNSKWRVIPMGGAMDEEAKDIHKSIVKALIDKKKHSKLAGKLVEGDVVTMRDFKGHWVYVGKHKFGFDIDVCGSSWVKVNDNPLVHSRREFLKCSSLISFKSLTPRTIGITVNRDSIYNSASLTEYKHEIKEADGAYLTFVRIKDVSKTGTVSNKDFMKNGTKWETREDNQVALFKGKSVQIQPTGEVDKGTLEKFLGGGLSYAYFEASAIAHYQMFPRLSGEVIQRFMGNSMVVLHKPDCIVPNIGDEVHPTNGSYYVSYNCLESITLGWKGERECIKLVPIL